MKRVKLPKDEAVEQELLRTAAKFTSIARQQLDWAHERTEAAMEAGRHEEADGYSETAYLWLSKLTGGD